MDERKMEWWGTATMVGIFLLIGAPVVLYGRQGEGMLTGPAWLWWGAYFGYFVAFLATFWPHGWRWLTPSHGVAALTVLSGVLVVVGPQGWTAVLLVFTVATAAHVVPVRYVVAIGAANCVLLLVASSLDGASVTEAVFGAAMYGGLQALTSWAVLLQLREAEAAKRLAVLHAELRATTALLAESSRSAERLRISRDLHDVVGHQLTALALELEVAAHKVPPPAHDHVARARGLAKDLLVDVRAAVGELRDRPADLRDALAEVVADLPRPRVQLDVDPGLAVDAERVATLVRCVQEIVTNTIRHADAYELHIRVRGDDDEVVLTARDDGAGAPVLTLGNGLTGMRERVEQFGGTATFQGHPGFRVEVVLPAPRRTGLDGRRPATASTSAPEHHGGTVHTP